MTQIMQMYCILSITFLTRPQREGCGRCDCGLIAVTLELAATVTICTYANTSKLAQTVD